MFGEAVTWTVVVNDEAQYSVWPQWRELPPGWSGEGTVGDLEQCVARIEQVWQDLRPAGLRDRLAGPPPAGEAR
ncbi:MbtH family protein [Kitasatospora phosalacinea]|uniref:PhpA n=1 Tax=Kitasatospora phosalacinea TaxID=2065 RepID=A0A0M3N0F0_9ACTN|nr:MbtH family NRPS accessory protein [Kitasatospora phosalacinea]AKO69598.1 phpA [Kitasatospora phosalacinea]